MKYLMTIISLVCVLSCDFRDKETIEIQKMAWHWHNKEIKFPTLPLEQDTLLHVFMSKKYKIFTYIDTMGCTLCNLGLLDWKKIISEADSLTKDIAFIFFAHVKDYKELEENIKNNNFNYPVFYDYEGECDKLNHLPKHVFYQTFLLDNDNKVLVMGKPKPNNEIWKLYKSIITSAKDQD